MKIESLHDIKSAIRITGNESGPSVVVFGGTHGNEVSGIHAIEKVLFDFYTGTRELISGTVTIVRVNEEAIQAKKRFIE
ncbi:succinylglutamate desuccinylase/aspartoacylase family protein, partial [Patescibacteria group bacterium]|nr:succinylglutamate desuccinylase/aspartoacylase family protein [Patescibacteria group bacterium]